MQKAKSQPRDSSNPTGATAAESIRKMISAKPKFSKKINYSVITNLFGGEASTSGVGGGGGSRSKKRRREDMEDEGADSDGGYGWGALNRSGSVVSSRAPSRYGSPSDSGAQTPKQQYGNGLFAPADDDEDDGEDEEEEEEEGGRQGGAEGEMADMMRRAQARPEEEEEEGEV